MYDNYCLMLALFIFISIRGTFCANKCVHIEFRGCPAEEKHTTCHLDDICRKTFNVSIVKMPPYSTYPIESILRKCCENCTKLGEINYFSNLTEVTPMSINSSDFVLLFLGSSSAVTLYGYHFIPVVYAPSVFYITEKDKSVLQRLVKCCFRLYPLIVICLLMAVIAGFLAWLMETWNNVNEFPRPFLSGWFEGFWWGFVSMTTVGYGEKIPKSIHARIFSIIWILIGVAMFGIFTASLTAEIMKVNNPKEPQMTGANVGTLKYREYDASIIAKHGGMIIESKGWDFESDILQLIVMLKKKIIDGILLDKYTLRYVSNYLPEISVEKKYEHLKDDINFFIKDTLRTEKMTSEQFSYGILVKYFNDYEYFRSAITDNRMALETDIALDYNEMEEDIEEYVLFSPSAPFFTTSLNYLFGIIGMICAFGLVFELWRRYIVVCESQASICNKYSCANQNHLV